jgi:uncharacterized protein YjiS (DUF1127 family)
MCRGTGVRVEWKKKMDIVQQLLDQLSLQFRAYETRRSLERLSDRSLADLGMERDLLPEIAALAAIRNRGTVSLSEIRLLAKEAVDARIAERQSAAAPSPLASLLGTPKAARLATAE